MLDFEVLVLVQSVLLLEWITHVSGADELHLMCVQRPGHLLVLSDGSARMKLLLCTPHSFLLICYCSHIPLSLALALWLHPPSFPHSGLHLSFFLIQLFCPFSLFPPRLCHLSESLLLCSSWQPCKQSSGINQTRRAPLFKVSDSVLFLLTPQLVLILCRSLYPHLEGNSCLFSFCHNIYM